MKKATKRGLLATGFAAVAIGACGDTVEVVTPPFPDIPPITIPPPVIPPPPPPPVNQAPTAVGAIPAVTVAVGAESSFDAVGYFSDPDGDALTYSAGSSNDAAASVSMDGSNVTITGVANGTAVVTITARDPDGAAAAQGVSVTVGRGDVTNSPPTAVGSLAAREVGVGRTTTVNVTGKFADADGDDLTYSAESSNDAVATVSMEGVVATITGVAEGSAVVTITATDPDGAAAAQEVGVTVTAPAANTPPAAQGTISDYSVAVGGTASVDVAGYFNDADGDELSYSTTSSNDAVATTAMEGSSLTVTGVADGTATVNVTATDPSGAAAAQSFQVVVGRGAPAEMATVAIFGLRDVTDRNTSVDPTNVSGDVSVLLDVQPNDETITAIDLMLGEHTISCRGSSSSDMGDLASAGGQVEVDCFLNTDAVMGECTGMQLDPMFANGAYELGARITVEGGEHRMAIASQSVTLSNSGHVVVAHSAGSSQVLKQGVAMYGGPSGEGNEGNLNSFHVCPVSYKGTDVGKISLRALSTGADNGMPHTAGTSLSFKAPTGPPANQTFNGASVDMEGPFTWEAQSAWNGAVEDEGPGGREHWIFAAETITNADGLDVSEEFGTSGADPHGPYYFDFQAPEAGGITINKMAVMAGAHYSGAAANAFGLASMTDAGAGVNAMSRMIAVGDCSNPANLPRNAVTKLPNRTTTPFVAMYDNVSAVADLAEDDAARAPQGQTDNNGVDCYVAELTALADELGNQWSGGADPATWMQTPVFGVDKTAAVLSDMEPESGLVFRALPEMEFEVDNPDLASGDDGTALTTVVTRAGDQAPVGSVMLEGQNNRDGTVMLDASNAYFGDDADGAKTVNVTISDGATPPNRAGYSLSFGLDRAPPTLSISRTQPNIGAAAGNAASVTVSVAGSVSDRSEIEEATLMLIEVGGSAAGNDTTLAKRGLENGTNSIAFDESFTIKKPAQDHGSATYRFSLAAEDVAVEADARGDGNSTTFDLGTYTVAWPGTPPTPGTPGPTFEFSVGDKLSVVEGKMDSLYYVKLKNVPSDQKWPVNATVTAPAGVSVDASTLAFNAATDSAGVTITAEHDTDIVSEAFALTHSATGFTDAALTVTSLDDDFEIMVTPMSIREDDDAVVATVTVNAGMGADVTSAVTVQFAAATGATNVDFDNLVKNVDVTVDSTTRTGMDTVTVDAADDDQRDELNESLSLTVSNSTVEGVYYKPASIMVMDDDPDIMLSLSQSSVNEDAGTVSVTITATADAPVLGIVNLELGLGGTAMEGSGRDYQANPKTVMLMIDTGMTTGTATVTLTIEDDSTDESAETIIWDDADGAEAGGKTYTVGPATLTIVDNDGT